MLAAQGMRLELLLGSPDGLRFGRPKTTAIRDLAIRGNVFGAILYFDLAIRGNVFGVGLHNALAIRFNSWGLDRRCATARLLHCAA